MKLKINNAAFTTIVVSVVVIKDLVEIVGTPQTIRDDVYTWWESILVFAFGLIFFLLGKYSKFNFKK